MAAYERECPNEANGCEGSITFSEESSESYTNMGLSVWTHHYLVMDSETCSAGCVFTEDEIKQLEKDADESAAEIRYAD